MNTPASRLITALIAIVLLVPGTFFIAPRPVYAVTPAVPTTDLLNLPALANYVKTAYGVLQAALTQVNTYTTMLANYAQLVNTYVLQPLAFVLSGQLMKALTASVMKFVIGKANGTGIPQFTVDIQRSLRSISDFQKNAYLRQVSLTNSPFASSIAQALGINYNQSTSLAGFWAANQNTLGRNIPTYQPGYLSGNWSQGGTAAWFQLTTQTQNNPYILYQSVQTQLKSSIGEGVGGSSGARMAQLQWGQGFMSWCGASDVQSSASSNYQSCIAACNDAGYTSACADKCGTNFQTDGGTIAGGGVNPGDPCTRSNGTPGTIQTPGSTIKATLDKVLGGQQDKLVQMGNISAQVNAILGNIGTVLNTVNLAANILGGSSNGLIDAGSPKGSLTQWGSASAPPRNFGSGGYFGATNSQIQQNSGIANVTTAVNTDRNAVAASVPRDTNADGLDSGTASSSDMLARIKDYQIAWNAIGAVASTTATSLKSMMAACHTYYNGNSSYETAAQNALSFEVLPVFTQVAAAQTVINAATAQYNLVQAEIKSTNSISLANNVRKLNAMPPTASDVATAKYNATAYGGGTANPPGSLTVSGSSIVDQMNLIRNNAASIQSSSCTVIDNGGAGA